MERCIICQSTIQEGDYCEAHLIAKKNLEKKFSAWKKAYDGLSWSEYLSQIVNNPDVPIGEWAKEVAEFLLKKEESQ
ncbi:MAG: hypothetical protein GF308_04925 [Candidatus Heimdallarchaeota archaeon]|nr:hypothetical protein [Candidatus Heimdallarchaeota archaeon]